MLKCSELVKEPSFSLENAYSVELRHFLALTGQVCWKESFQLPISGPCFPLDTMGSACSGLFGLRGFTPSLLRLAGLYLPCQ